MSLSLQILRQSAAELLACAILDLFPNAELFHGGSTDQGFYYDFHTSQPINEHAISLIEEKMRALIKENTPIRSLEMMRENAATLFVHHSQKIKAAIVAESKANIVPILQMGDFYDYCPPPYISALSEMGGVKILSIEPARVHLGEKEIRVVRIQGIACPDTPTLKKTLKSVEAAKKRNHVQLAKNMRLFEAAAEASLDHWLWLPKGVTLRDTLINWWKKQHQQQNFQFVHSPTIIKADLMNKSGLLGHLFHENPPPLFTFQGEDYTWRTALAPFHALAFKTIALEQEKLPIRLAECAELHDNQQAPPIEGMFRTHSFWSDAAHLFCTPDQVVDEIISSLQFIDKIINILGFEYHWYLGLKTKKHAGSLNSWKKGTAWLTKALDTCGFSYAIDKVESARFGPFAEARLTDSLGREWQGPQLSIDLNSPERYGLSYPESDGKMQAPIMLARTLFRSLERFIAIAIEHYGGLFPLWLAPEQVRVMSIMERNRAYAENVRSLIEAAGFRVTADYRQDRLGNKIHAAENEKVPFMVILGDKEEQAKAITVRSSYQEEKKITESFVEVFLAQLREKTSSKTWG